jgi:hypothetical protein
VGSSTRLSSLPVLALALAAALLVTKVEPICKANTEANSRILKGVKDQVKQGKLVPAGKRFIRASGALGKSVAQMAKVPQPSADATKLTKWIGYLKSEQGFLRSIGKALKANDKFKAQKLAVKLNRNNNKANNTVISFGFKECRIDSSKFI